MNRQHDDDTTLITLELPSGLTVRLADLRQRFGDELLVDILRVANAKVEGKLALRGALLNQDCKRNPI